MKLTLRQKLAKSISHGLARAAVTSCSKWSERYRIMTNPFPGPWTFNNHPWLLEIHDAETDTIVGQKSAQVGFTEAAINLAFFYMDIRSLDVLYILPTASEASRFSSSRFDPALALSPYLAGLFTDVNNVALKRAGTSTLHVCGSHSKSKLKSIPTAVVIFDELDEMADYTVALASERQSGQLFTKTFKLSTPTITGVGINQAFMESSEEYYYFRCPHCGRLTNLIYPDCLVVFGDDVTDQRTKESYLQCKECKTKLDHETKSTWLKHRDRGGSAFFVPTNNQRDARGFHISQLYSMAKVGKPENLAIASIRARTDPTCAQEWYNSKLGVTYTAPGAKITLEQINQCVGSFRQGEINPTLLRTIGIDVGSVLHIVVKEWYQRLVKTPDISLNDCFDCRVILDKMSSGSAGDFDEAADVFNELKVNAGVIDGEPERRMAQQLSQRFKGRLLLCDYLYSQRGRSVILDQKESTLKVNRTPWLDLSLSRFKNKTTLLAQDTSPTYKAQIMSPTRVLRVDRYGQSYAVYVNDGPDHFAHADVYAEIAFPFAMGLGKTTDIQGMY
jgi:hypothetical protein